MTDFLGTLAVLLLLITSLYILVNQDWRWAIAALGLQYVWAFLLLLMAWPAELAVVKLVTGWIAASVLGLTRLNLPQLSTPQGNVPSGRVFRLLAAGLVLIMVLGAAPRLADWSRAFGIYQAWGGLLLLGMGLMQLALRNGFFRTALGLLTLFSGFEILYAAVEGSTLVIGLLTAVNLGIALVTAYLLTAPTLEAEE